MLEGAWGSSNALPHWAGSRSLLSFAQFSGVLSSPARHGLTSMPHDSTEASGGFWGGQVLDDKDPYIPLGAEPPRRGAVPVRFFGTYEFSYIQSQRALAPFDDPLDHRRTKCDDPVSVPLPVGCGGPSARTLASAPVRAASVH